MNPDDPESVERAASVIRQYPDMFGFVLRTAIFSSWVELTDFDAVELKYRAFLDSALRDFRTNPDEYLLSIDPAYQSFNVQLKDDSASMDSGEQQIRIAIYMFWIGLDPVRRRHDILESEFRRILDDSLRTLRDDPTGFGSECR
ncbi:hypothetical protein FYK55_26830 [Roseiconus nitratireducens]|uniref:Uncharacterized protein n=1 Tax=Roseiconus nitratireducens TaxID=2605748 RepID=A0A5M6CW72_9BACT|nr:hypothetical protein [Roseiconus nitratireducens]KAA5538630.1 hypothetical protein FYK55_26830 [Roseiconus nitratireducens]